MVLRSNGQSGGQRMCFVLPDGASVLIRAAQPEERGLLERMFYQLSLESRYRYFFLPVPLEPRGAARLGALAWADGHDHHALVALVGSEIVGWRALIAPPS
jgi:hypothetical protein